ncbi:histidine kinase N-terminal domain-containing protein [Rossellomorea sp. BNER]|uniref:histidine kinase N-terminal domain-containing protein n=1 Tax=Rossellomorea sp. BNER TaxID=2962031 RepID=UPI003AF2F3A9
MAPVSDRLIQFLENNISTFLDNWREKVLIHPNDVHSEKVIMNGLRMFELVRKTLSSPISEEEIKKLSLKVARERVEANVNIGEFVYNVNLGRTEIINWISSSGIQIEELQPVFVQINSLFDQFSYYSVRYYTDIKEQHLQEKNLFIDQTHKDRLSILGQMASSFVHEFRNPLTSIVGFIKLLNKEHPDINYIDIVSHELEQMNFRISQFLHVSKNEVFENRIEIFSLSQMLENLMEFLYPSLVDSEVNVVTRVDPSILISGNKDEIRQVFLNIMINSIDALYMEEDYREIIIEGKIEHGNIVIHMINNGPKIEQDNMMTIFEPFYTTKELGTGIGLYVCRKLINKHGGEISCQSEEEATKFMITLPSKK